MMWGVTVHRYVREYRTEHVIVWLDLTQNILTLNIIVTDPSGPVPGRGRGSNLVGSCVLAVSDETQTHDFVSVPEGWKSETTAGGEEATATKDTWVQKPQCDSTRGPDAEHTAGLWQLRSVSLCENFF